jgi:hypothetical protein
MLYSPFADDASTRPGLIELGQVVSVVPSLQLDGLTTYVGLVICMAAGPYSNWGIAVKRVALGTHASSCVSLVPINCCADCAPIPPRSLANPS